MTARHLVLAGLAFAAVPGCSRPASGPAPDTRFDQNKGLFATLPAADTVALYEGLPHQHWEREALEREKARKETVDRHGFPFYRKPLDLTVDEVGQLKKVFGDDRSFRQLAGAKKCGGFHPDYCLEWTAGGRVYDCLVCLGCSEVKVYGPDEALYCDIEFETGKGLKKLFEPHRSQRPPGTGD